MINKFQNILDNLGFESLNTIQLAVSECKADNAILLAPTGAGKTLAYMLRSLDYINAEEQAVQTLIVTPSRELALQTEAVFRSMSCGYSITPLYGGHPIMTEKRSLRYLPQFVVATPGRLLDHLKHYNINGDTVTHIIFDEFDKLLEMGFSEEMTDIMTYLPKLKHHTLTSATRADSYPEFISKHTFETLDFLTGEASGTLHYRKIEAANEEDKIDKLMTLLKIIGHEPTIIFCNYREQSERLSDYLYDHYVENEYFHGGMEQFERERALTKLRNGSANILVSTDLAARGLDIRDLKHIVHFELPDSESSYIHRNGRTARVDAEGVVYVFDESTTPEWADVSSFAVMSLDNAPSEMPLPDWETIYIGRGKKDKLNKVDIVGFLCRQGDLVKSEIGIIEVKDHHSFVAVKLGTGKDLVRRVRDHKIKNTKTKIRLSF